jgi:hypothetical protein
MAAVRIEFFGGPVRPAGRILLAPRVRRISTLNNLNSWYIICISISNMNCKYLYLRDLT